MTTAKTLRLTLAQINPTVGALADNAAAMRRIVMDHAGRSDLVIFPELALSGYPPEDLVLKPFFLDEVERTVRRLCADTKDGPAFLLPCPWRGSDGGLHNAALLAQGGEIRHRIYKTCLPNYGVFDERRYFVKADLPEPFELNGVRIGALICEDMWLPEVAAHLKSREAEILVSPNASPFELGKKALRLKVARERVAETGLPIVYVNQIIGQDELVFDGGSFALNESGALLAACPRFAEDVRTITLEKTPGGQWLAEPAEIPEEVSDEQVVYNALLLGLRDYITKNGFQGVLIGMSGGIDSALTAALAVDALGPQAVRCVMMPSRFTSAESLDDAAACAKALGAPYEVLSIEPMLQAYEKNMQRLDGLAHENTQSRCRGTLLMALSNQTGHMVLTTGNKSEMATGYATLYGDMCGGFNALKDVYKSQVFALARWRNAHQSAHGLGPGGEVIPQNIIDKPPSAELRDGQKDEDSLPPYDQLDDILSCLIEKDMALEDITARGHARETVCHVWTLLDRAEYKRRQAAPGVKITPRAFGKDRRYPITNGFRLQETKP